MGQLCCEMSTHYHSQYWAHALSLRGSGGDIAALSRSLANARVEMEPLLWYYCGRSVKVCRL